MNRFLTIVFCLSFVSLSAHAQERQYKAGLNYTTLAKPKTQEAKPAEAATLETEAETQDKKVDPATAAWNKYKDLATGEAGEEDSKEARAPEAPEKPTVEKPTKPTLNGEQQKQEQQQNAFSAILDEWKSTKKSQREMRSKSFRTPSTPAKQP